MTDQMEEKTITWEEKPATVEKKISEVPKNNVQDSVVLKKDAESGLQGGKSMNIGMQKIKNFLNMFQKYLGKAYDFVRDNKNNSKIMLFVALVTTGLAIYFGLQLYNDIKYLNAKSEELNYLSNYDVRTLENTESTQTIIKNSDTINDILEENIATA